MSDIKSHSRPPNKAAKPAVPGKPTSPAKPKPKVPSLITGGMTVEITIGEVHITVEGPVVKVLAVLNWLFGSKEPGAMIARLQLAFGPEVSVTHKGTA